jgi:hypothetical protein
MAEGTAGVLAVDPLETVQRWTWETDGMEKDQDAGPWVRLEDVQRALGVAPSGGGEK